ncbi:hypothetical protein BURPSPAST_AA1169 [Burkholderia pseudomallei Pasteur 52237]|nr:hypothetical protein BURPSPAST_AA1169 [Burkholderia pseudomallei Pasteur 52237]
MRRQLAAPEAADRDERERRGQPAFLPQGCAARRRSRATARASAA